MKFELFWNDDDILLTPCEKGGPFLPTNILLPTGHAVEITSKGNRKNPRFDVTILVPNEALILSPAYVKGIDHLAFEESWEYAIQQGGETRNNHQSYRENNPTITDIGLHQVRMVMNDLIKRRLIVDENLVPQIALVNRKEHNGAADSYPITQFNGEQYDPSTARPRDLLSFAQGNPETLATD